MQFLNRATDEDLRRFTRTWGPLDLRATGDREDEWQTGRVKRSLVEYRAALRRFRGVKGILEAAKGNGDERAALFRSLSPQTKRSSSSTRCISPAN